MTCCCCCCCRCVCCCCWCVAWLDVHPQTCNSVDGGTCRKHRQHEVATVYTERNKWLKGSAMGGRTFEPFVSRCRRCKWSAVRSLMLFMMLAAHDAVHSHAHTGTHNASPPPHWLVCISYPPDLAPTPVPVVMPTSGLPGASSKSNRRMNMARATSVSNSANWSPIHLRRPPPKGKYAKFSVIWGIEW